MVKYYDHKTQQKGIKQQANDDVLDNKNSRKLKKINKTDITFKTFLALIYTKKEKEKSKCKPHFHECLKL